MSIRRKKERRKTKIGEADVWSCYFKEKEIRFRKETLASSSDLDNKLAVDAGKPLLFGNWEMKGKHI